MVRSLAGKGGKLDTADVDSDEFSGNFYRARVLIDVREPLRNHVSMVKNLKRQFFLVKYERLPDWCAVCGMIGHLHTEHGDGVHPPSVLIFKDLRASWSRRSGGRARGRGRRGTGAG